MIKFGEKNFLLTDNDGNEAPFNAAELQSELIYCFLSAGMRENSCFAEDIALAVEYSVHEKENFGGRISESELADMVIATLESADFHAVAEWFRRRNHRAVEVFFATSVDGLKEFAVRNGLLQALANESLLQKVSNAFNAMDVPQASPGLIVEMIRFFNSSADIARRDDGGTNIISTQGNYIIKIQEIMDDLPQSLIKLLKNKVLRINDVTVYHPSIRLYLDPGVFAALNGFAPPLTEMFWMPFAAELGQSIDAAIEAVHVLYSKKGGKKQLPVYLTVNGMGTFMEKYFGAEPGQGNKLAAFLIESLTENMFNSFYKVRF